MQKILSVVFLFILLLTGCTSAPSVLPMLDRVGVVLTEERAMLAEDGKLVAGRYEQTRDMLRDAYEKDLAVKEGKQISADWVIDATRVYVAAREILLKQMADEMNSLETRMRNLDLAKEAQSKAVQMMRQQDELMLNMSGVSFWDWLGNKRHGEQERSER